MESTLRTTILLAALTGLFGEPLVTEALIGSAARNSPPACASSPASTPSFARSAAPGLKLDSDSCR